MYVNTQFPLPIQLFSPHLLTSPLTYPISNPPFLPYQRLHPPPKETTTTRLRSVPPTTLTQNPRSPFFACIKRRDLNLNLNLKHRIRTTYEYIHSPPFIRIRRHEKIRQLIIIIIIIRTLVREREMCHRALALPLISSREGIYSVYIWKKREGENQQKWKQTPNPPAGCESERGT